MRESYMFKKIVFTLTSVLLILTFIYTFASQKAESVSTATIETIPKKTATSKMESTVKNKTEHSFKQTPKILAHRGANDRFNENTITAHKIAADDGVDALEMDLRMTKDGSLIIMHDQTINRTTNGKKKVSELTLDELKAYQTIGRYNGKTTTEDIPTLREVIEAFTDTEHYYIETRLVNRELKMEEPLIELLNEYHLISKGLVTIQSFSPQSLEKIQRLAPNVPLTLLFGKGKFDLEMALTAPYPNIGIESTDVTLSIVNELHQAGKEVHVYFTNKKTEKNEQARVKAFQVDGYFTDYINYTKQLLGQWTGSIVPF
jgi:glycerophosphoryl diester phosphodiesterase/2,3-bisphosphoglycerate-dependent phosphoglycerate mutase